MIIINLKDLYPADSQQQLTDKLNYNFNQLLRLGVGEPGPQGDVGPQGNQGIIGMDGPAGVRGSYWYSGNYSDPVLDPAMSGSPDPKIVNDCYLSTASGNLAMWQYKPGAPNYWEMVVDLEQAISVHISATSPFTRPGGSPAPPNWNSVIIPYPVPSTGLFDNTLLMASEFQTALYTGSHASANSNTLRGTQVALLGGTISPIRHALAIGEMDYDYSAGLPDTSNPYARLNNAMRISTRYKHASPKVMPSFAASVFDAASFEPGEPMSLHDVTTGFEFKMRHAEQDGSDTYYNTNVYFAGKKFLTAYGVDLGDIGSATTDFSGITVANTNLTPLTVAIGANANIDGLQPYGYVLANDIVSRMYVNKSWIPLKINPASVMNLGLAGTNSTQWNNLYVKSGIGYTDEEPLKFWRNIQNSAYSLTDTNCVMTLTTAGKIAVGLSISNYKGVGAKPGLSWGASPVATGNDNNKAVVHIYEHVSTAPEVAMLDEAGLLVEKKWSYLDRFSGTGLAGTKMSLFVHNAIEINASAYASPGSPAADLAPDATAAYIMQGQLSADLTAGIVTNMTGINVYSYANANAANMVDVVGVVSTMEFLLSGGITSTSANSTIAFKAVVPSSHVTYTVENNAARYGFYQSGATDALNMFEGHISFSGNGSGHTIPGYGVASGHVIDILNRNGAALHVVSGYAVSGQAGNLHLYAGHGATGAAGGHALLMGGSTDGAENSGDVYVMAGALTNSATSKTGGNVYISGAFCGPDGGHVIPGMVIIAPSIEYNSHTGVELAGNIAIGYAKMGSALGGAYDYGSHGLVGFGTINPIEKVHINGNIAISANTTNLNAHGLREIYVQSGAMDEDNATQIGYGASLRIKAGDGRTSGISQKHGGTLYLVGGVAVGKYYPLHPLEHVYDGSVILAYDGDTAVGRVGIRKATNTLLTSEYADVDIHGNVRNDGDIMWGELNHNPGWCEVADLAVGEWTAASGIRLYTHANGDDGVNPFALADGELVKSSIRIRAKRIGSVAILNIEMVIDFSILPVAPYTAFYIGWNPAVTCAAELGSFGRVRIIDSGGGINYRRLHGNYFNSSVYNGSVYLPCEASAGRNGVVAYGNISANWNVLSFVTPGYTDDPRFVIGQAIVEMDTPDVSTI